MVERVMLTPKNEDVQKLNNIIINHFLGEEHNLLSFDGVEGDTQLISTGILTLHCSRLLASTYSKG